RAQSCAKAVIKVSPARINGSRARARLSRKSAYIRDRRPDRQRLSPTYASARLLVALNWDKCLRIGPNRLALHRERDRPMAANGSGGSDLAYADLLWKSADSLRG